MSDRGGIASIGELRQRLADVVATLDPELMPATAAPAWWTELDRVERLAAAGKTLLAGRVEQSGVWKDAGHKDAAEHLARLAGTGVGTAREALATSARLKDLSRVESSVRRGELSAAQAAMIADAATADPAAEGRLLDMASRVSLPELREECLRVKAKADPDPERTHERIRRGRRLRRFTDAEGGWNITGRGTADAGAGFNAVLDPIIDELFREAHRRGDREPREAYAFDALMELGRRAGYAVEPGPAPAGAPDPAESRVPRPRSAADDQPVNRDSTLCDEKLGEPVPDPTPAPAAFRRRRTNERYLALLRLDVEALHRGAVAGEERCEIAGVGVRRARELLGEAVLKLVITKGVDVVNVTHLGRGPTVAQKTALLWDGHRCTAEGCPRTATEIDHREDWARTRHTRLDELDKLCGHDHDLKTRHGWALVSGHGRRAFVPPEDPRHPRHHTRKRRRVAPTARAPDG